MSQSSFKTAVVGPVAKALRNLGAVGALEGQKIQGSHELNEGGCRKYSKVGARECAAKSWTKYKLEVSTLRQ